MIFLVTHLLDLFLWWLRERQHHDCPPLEPPQNWHTVIPATVMEGDGRAALGPDDSAGGLEDSTQEPCLLGSRRTF